MLLHYLFCNLIFILSDFVDTILGESKKQNPISSGPIARSESISRASHMCSLKRCKIVL